MEDVVRETVIELINQRIRGLDSENAYKPLKDWKESDKKIHAFCQKLLEVFD